MRTKYSSARGLISFIGIVGWVGLIAGTISLFFGFSNPSTSGAMLIGAGISTAMFGLVLVAISNVATAVLDTGDNTHQTNELLRAIAANQGVDLSRLEAKKKSTAPRQAPVQQPANTSNQQRPIEFRGEMIVPRDNRWHWDGQAFLTLGKAKAAIKEVKSAVA